MNQLRYNYNYLVKQHNGYHGAKYVGRHVRNAVLPSTFDEQYEWPRRDSRKLIIGICLLAVVAFVAVFELGLLDGVYLWLMN